MKDTLSPVLQKALFPLFRELNIENPEAFIELQRPPEAKFGDFSLNTAMRLAKPAKQPPQKIAQRLVELLKPIEEWFGKVEVVGPGFVNLFCTDASIEKALTSMACDQRLGVPATGNGQIVVIDYSSVNIAKQMHVGHLRSTIIGDVLARVLEALGYTVIRQNHLGDWGVPIAMVIWKTAPILRDLEQRGLDPAQELSLSRLEEIYRQVTQECASDPAKAEECRKVLVSLQAGDPQLVKDWETITRISMSEVYRIYRLLNVTLTEKDERGESFYRDRLAQTVQVIRESGKLEESQGAQCVFLQQFKTKDGSPLPIIVQKSDGGYNYETFDLAAVRYRIADLHADRVIYVTDARQALHFSQFFAVADTCGWTNKNSKRIPLEHVTFGSVMGEDNKPLKTRSGENVKLSDLLAEAVERSLNVVREKNGDLSPERQQAVAEAVGIGAVKYADLSNNRNNDYVFSWDRMLALNGNTAPYLQYAHARICSIFRKGKIDETAVKNEFRLAQPAERTLAMKLLQFPEVVSAVTVDLRPHVLCTYLFELAVAFSTFYDQCPVLTASEGAERNSRLGLCGLCRRVLARGLDLLGIAAPQEM
ncbi:MAG TPA: arginine--tRNA ligase [Candidatus Ozemobacteraceae bacterium]|nr:arginine--tRNA ligase [Candidatus Ozemobacteraceae bacterium]